MVSVSPFHQKGVYLQQPVGPFRPSRSSQLLPFAYRMLFGLCSLSSAARPSREFNLAGGLVL